MSWSCLDLFSGAGGFTKGLLDADMQVVCGIDHWERATETLRANVTHPVLCKDLETFGPADLAHELALPALDLIVGGPPCQGHSIAGRRNPCDPRNTLFRAFVAYVQYFQPKAFVMENVMGILSSVLPTGERCATIIQTALEECGYRVNVCKLYASDFQVPQRRRRVFFMGIRRDLGIEPTAPTETYPEIPVRTVLETAPVGRLELSARAISGIERRRREMKEAKKGFGAQILDMDKPSYTISARYWKDGYDALVPLGEGRLRRLSVTELKRIQTFSDDYVLKGNRQEQITQLGNAVPPRLVYHVVRHLRALVQGTV